MVPVGQRSDRGSGARRNPLDPLEPDRSCPQRPPRRGGARWRIRTSPAGAAGQAGPRWGPWTAAELGHHDRHGRIRAVVPLALALGLGAVGCSSDGTATVAETTTSSSSSTTAAGPPLAASFTIDLDLDTSRPTSCPLRSITFTDTSEGDPTSWAWSFPDGSTSDEQSPVVTPESDERGDWFGEVTLTVSRGDVTRHRHRRHRPPHLLSARRARACARIGRAQTPSLP